MNPEPHRHQVEVRHRYGGGGGWIVRYGDTVVYVSFIGRLWCDHVERPLSERRVKRAIRRAIRRHDKGSLKAGRRAAQADTSYHVAVVANKVLLDTSDRWASEVLGELTTHQPEPA